MINKVRVELKQFNRSQLDKSWKVYTTLLCRLCQTHIQYEPCKKILALVRNKKYGLLYEYADSLSAATHADATSHFVANQLALLIKKYPFPKEAFKADPTFKLDPLKAAMEKFEASEVACKAINEVFDKGVEPPHLSEAAHHMRGFIRFVIGESPSLPWILNNAGFGPGASMGVHGNATNLARKMASDWSVTPSALQYAWCAIHSHDQMFEAILPRSPDGSLIVYDIDAAKAAFMSRIRLIEHNKIAFVPKTAKTHRSIAVEPLLNSFLQKGADLDLRRKLQRVGLDLSDQSFNQALAREGSLPDQEDPFCTIDLSSASDSIAIEVVRSLLPYDWFAFLNACRSQKFITGDREVTYEKFCSMGNGFCFPLETLLFASICSAAGAGHPGRDFLVYGDDIIVRRSVFERTVALLKSFGFNTNTEKTFNEGPFRESCGADWFNGEDVRPFTLDYALDSLENIFKVLNLTERNERTRSFFEPIRSYLIELIPPKLRFSRLHDGNPDTGYRARSREEFEQNLNRGRSMALQADSWLELLTTPVNDRWQGLRNADTALLMAALMGVSSKDPFTVRRKTRTTVRRVAYG